MELGRDSQGCGGSHTRFSRKEKMKYMTPVRLEELSGELPRADIGIEHGDSLMVSVTEQYIVVEPDLFPGSGALAGYECKISRKKNVLHLFLMMLAYSL